MINTLHFSGAQVGAVYGSSGLASLIMPSLVGIIADRFIKVNRLYGICHFLVAICAFADPFLHDFALNLNYKDRLAVKYPAILLSIGQSSKVFFILSYRFSYVNLGLKRSCY
ncbi:hypothetical protein ACE38V_10340 [Cytobacillus sp. Hz8]|uniref:hypothetical protein n=1 Tax=Cytobacillus sp. Hz8 TaxID=3347168 RepID=UPI0035DA464E